MKKKDYVYNIIFKQEEVIKTYEKWVYVLQNKNMISEYLMQNNYHKIAIYGLGRIGKQLYKELASSQLTVSYVIDQGYSITNKYYNQVPCYHPDDRLPNVDLIIVTVPSESEEIIKNLNKKVSCSVKSINEVLFVIE